MLRDAVPDDHAALRSIFRRASLSNEGDRPLLLANPGHLQWREPTGTDAFRVRVDLFVKPALMRRGIGLALVGDAAHLAGAAGCSVLAVTANPHAAAFYAAAGFVGCATIKTPLGAGTRLRLRLTAAR
jgi:GNAT superfamily N-acetyltransferase